MNPPTHSNQLWWDPNAGPEPSMNADALWSQNQASAAAGPYYGIPHEQHGYYPSAHPDDVQPRTHRPRKRTEQDSDVTGEYRINSHRPVWSVPSENVSQNSKESRYAFEESCHEFRARPDGMDSRHGSSRKKSNRRQATHYGQEEDYDGDYGYEIQGHEFGPKGSHDETPGFYCPQNCGFVGMDKNSLRKHMSIHKDKRFSCEKCEACFHTPRDLRRHQEARHTMSKSKTEYICKFPGCDRDEKWPFKRKDNARQHLYNVHQMDDGDNLIREIIVANSSAQYNERSSETQFRAGHRPTGSSSTDDTVYSAVSYDSNPGYYSHEDLEDEDVMARFTTFEDYESDIDFDRCAQEIQPWSEDFGSGIKQTDLESRIQNRKRSKSEAYTRSASHPGPQQPLYYQGQGHLVQHDDSQQYQYTERCHTFEDASSANSQSHIKEESPAPRSHYPFGQTSSTAIRKPGKYPPDHVGKAYRCENPSIVGSLEDVFEKVLVI
ncbi:hypothetical protein TWF730_001834 [Orbilia blumenaviensis]|uniref:C2H2-type domain-containing protein n=1 Tax=Orbilia blumenaviensis TaxID=1796055 RepID=A0AAV9UGC5_9PEZI